MKKTLLTLFAVIASAILSAQNIYAGQTLEQNRKYWANNKQYYLIFQDDGNLVFYKRNGRSLWDSRTSGKGSRAVFQNDGNLVVYNGNQVTFSTKYKRKKGR